MNHSLKLFAAALAAVGLLAGCSSVSLDEGAKSGTLASEAVNPFEDPSNPLSQRSIYFAFDSYDVASEYAPVVEAHARWLVDHPEASVVVQGNTDERGGREEWRPSPLARKNPLPRGRLKRLGLRTAERTSFISNRIRRTKTMLVKSARTGSRALFLCAQHGRDLKGESPEGRW